MDDADTLFVAQVAHAFRCDCGHPDGVDMKMANPLIAERLRGLLAAEAKRYRDEMPVRVSDDVVPGGES